MENRINATATEETINSVVQTIRGLESYMPFLVSLSTDERKELLKLGEKSSNFVKKAMAMVKRDDSFLPRKFDTSAFIKDVELYNQLFNVLDELNKIHKKVEDTFMLVGSEAYAEALAVYGAAKASNRAGDLNTTLDELGKMFVRKQTKMNEAETK